MAKRIAVLFFLPLILSACISATPQPTPTPSASAITNLFDKKWIFQYAVENGEKTMEYQHLIKKQIWIALSSQLHQEELCKDLSPDGTIPSAGRCFSGYDGCNEFWGIYIINESGAFDIIAGGAYLLGCPVQIVTQINPETQEIEYLSRGAIYNSDPFNQALRSAVQVEILSNELKLYYPSTQQNYLLFHLAETE